MSDDKLDKGEVISGLKWAINHIRMQDEREEGHSIECLVFKHFGLATGERI